jgi:Cytochrome P460
MTRRISFVILTLVVLAGYQLVSSQTTSSSQKTTRSRTAGFNGYELVDQTGNIRKPTDFRDRYQLLGTWMVLDPKGNQMHVTYASPGTAEYYRKNGKFADGTVLVKEIFGTDHAQMTTGDVARASGIIQWFIMIKDEKKRFPDNPLWGDGWGWALFKADAPDKQVATDHSKDCIPCHIPAKSTDWTYVQGYPVLKSK